MDLNADTPGRFILHACLFIAIKSPPILACWRDFMSDSMVTIEAALRAQGGKSYCRKVRARGLIPGNIMEKSRSTKIELDPKLLSKAWLGNKKFTMVLGGISKTVYIHELQIHPVKRTALHVDLIYS